MHSLLLLAGWAGLVSAGAAADRPVFSFDELWSMEKNVWDQFLYPNNVKQINSTDESVFAEDVQGRVDITRTFTGRELNNEYIFGLFSQPNTISLTGIPIAYNITQFVANENTAAATTVITFNVTAFDVLLPLTIDSWMAFDENKKVAQYDAAFRWFEYYFDTIQQAAAKKFNTTDPAVVLKTLTSLLAESICEKSEEFCTTGEREHYSSHEECVRYLSEDTRFGKSYELGRDTLVCREVHKHMVGYRPDEHCSHIAPSGGAYCVDDMTYEQTVREKYFKESWVAYGYADDNIWVAK